MRVPVQLGNVIEVAAEALLKDFGCAAGVRFAAGRLPDGLQLLPRADSVLRETDQTFPPIRRDVSVLNEKAYMPSLVIELELGRHRTGAWGK
jgi:hypothetical protein